MYTMDTHPRINEILHPGRSLLYLLYSMIGDNASSTSEVIEHGPVQSTDRLEKPRHAQPATPAPTPAVATSATLPRRWGGSNRIVMQNNGEFKLRRNGSLADMRTNSTEPTAVNPLLDSSAVGRCTVAVRGQSQRQAAGNSEDLRVQVPAHVVKSIVVSVLHQQGVTHPSEAILSAAIQEYYAKNPQGVS